MRDYKKSLLDEKGFSLIELIIVVVIIGIIAAIAIPNLLQARRASNEASAISSVSLIHRSLMTYKTTEGDGEFTDLTGLYNRNYIDTTLGSTPHIKSGYRFEINVYPSTSSVEARYDLRARPIVHQITNNVTATGSRDFGVNEAGGIYETTDNTAVSFDPNTRLALGTAVHIDR